MNELPVAVVLCRGLPARWNTFTLFAVAFVAAWPLSAAAQPQPQRLNNLTALLIEAAPSRASETFSFTRPRDGWIFISAAASGGGEARLALDGNEQDTILLSSWSGLLRSKLAKFPGGACVFVRLARFGEAISDRVP